LNPQLARLVEELREQKFNPAIINRVIRLNPNPQFGANIRGLHFNGGRRGNFELLSYRLIPLGGVLRKHPEARRYLPRLINTYRVVVDDKGCNFRVTKIIKHGKRKYLKYSAYMLLLRWIADDHEFSLLASDDGAVVPYEDFRKAVVETARITMGFD
jgi:hypothetical protein